jgi:hypothetical protein
MYPETTSALHLLQNNPYTARTYPNAAAYLTDWTRALDILLVNGITDPTISTVQSIAIPRH